MKFENAKVVRLVERHATEFANEGAELGATKSIMFDGVEVSTKLFGFNSSRKGIIVETTIGNVKLGCSSLKLKPRGFTHVVNVNYNWLYNQAVQSVKEPRPIW